MNNIININDVIFYELSDEETQVLVAWLNEHGKVKSTENVMEEKFGEALDLLNGAF